MDLITRNYEQIEKMIRWAYQRHSSDFEKMRIEYEDFQSYAHEVLVLHIDKWDKSKGKLSTYLGSILENKSLSMIRDANRHKRIITHQTESLDREIPGKDNLTFGDTIPIDDQKCDSSRFSNYYDSLTPLQQKIIAMLGWGYSRAEIIEGLNITTNQFNSLSNDFSSILKRKKYFGKE